ncbi:MAG: hypothetical protein ACD_28C00108G0027 [uncultured bacterium]|nr:MAG: hypothetical protein ACD_28C00108G0027 [uncultured bacterium]KKT75386.1 MAG: hypothetical protein UW70_C0035G0007 [Candidatus Peregrinibacteria bacterium GW2011_GWA2_44_7]
MDHPSFIPSIKEAQEIWPPLKNDRLIKKENGPFKYEVKRSLWSQDLSLEEVIQRLSEKELLTLREDHHGPRYHKMLETPEGKRFLVQVKVQQILG